MQSDDMKMSDPGDPGSDLREDGPAVTLRLSVRDLAGYAYRHGGLGKAGLFSDSEDTPVRLHQQYIRASMKQDPDAEHFPEYTLKASRRTGSICMEIQGRADLVSVSPDGSVTVLEIKTIMDSGGVLPAKADIVHLAQARIYAYLFLLDPRHNEASVSVTIRYVLAAERKIRDFSERSDFTALQGFFDDSCSKLLDFTKSLRNYRKLRDITLRDLRFPYPELRKGQKEFMHEVLGCIRSKEPLYAQAPTGIGKTISVLYPAVKAIPKNYADYIFYLTAKTSTQTVAQTALQDLRNAGMVLRSIRITSKEKLCLRKDLYCDTQTCPYAIHYYDNSGAAIHDLFAFHSVDADILTGIAEKHQVCPFEIGLDLSLFCDVIICDYNYVFDPKVRLIRFFQDDPYRFVFLIDEAHNLPSRSNEMFSASFGTADIASLLRHAARYSIQLRNSLDAISRYFTQAIRYLDSAAESQDRGTDDRSAAPDSFDRKIEAKELFRAESICASRKIPEEFTGILQDFIFYAKQEIDLLKDRDLRKELLDAFFSAMFFVRVSTDFFNEHYVVLLSSTGKDALLRFKCLNASERLTAFHNGKNATVYFSATMSPEEYYTGLFKGRSSDLNLRKKIFASPFPPENLWVGVVTDLSIKYEARPYTLGSVAELALAAVCVRNGNYLVFCPSFEYQRMISAAFESLVRQQGPQAVGKPIRILTQKNGMSESERSAFLNAFLQNRSDTLVGFAVLGGVFGEGIDLTGESLSGVILIGVGLPARSFEQDILMDYFTHETGNGFDYAYRFPGFNKILQAAGRVIRTETDRGFILLIDERYGREDYRMLFPPEWDPHAVGNADELREGLEDFFGGSGFGGSD